MKFCPAGTLVGADMLDTLAREEVAMSARVVRRDRVETILEMRVIEFT